MNFAQKYVLFIKADTVAEVAEEALHIAYLFLQRALQEHRLNGRNGDYETFAIELLAFLQRNRHHYTTPLPEPPLTEGNE